MGILNLSKLAQVKMKFTSAILIGISASLARADWGPGGGFGGYGNGGDWGNNWGWGGAPDRAKTCYSSIFPAQSTAWSSACASQTIIDNCVPSACPTATAEYASASSVRSEWCSSYSSCSTASDSCTTNWPWWGGVNGDGWGGYWGGKGSNGVFTVTVTSGQASGLTPRTVTVTTTASGSQVRSTERYFRSGTSCCRPNLNSHFHKRCSSSNERCWSLGSCSFGCLYGPLRGR